MLNTKKRMWEIVEASKGNDIVSFLFDIIILSLVILNVVSIIIGTVESIQIKYGIILDKFELISIVIFSIEYLTRLWSCTISHKYNNPLWGRIKFIFSPMALIDLLAILPFYLPYLNIDLRTLRILRFLRIARLAKVGRYSSALIIIKNVIKRKKEELVLTALLMAILLIIASTLLYYCENESQPDIFSSIPSSMWWAIATITTVGYGDMYPITTMGRFCAGIIAILGVGMFALPTGILGAGFVEEINNKNIKFCPHCKKQI